MRTAFNCAMDGELLRRARCVAHSLGVNLSSLIECAIEPAVRDAEEQLGRNLQRPPDGRLKSGPRARKVRLDGQA
jgi:hypothetical protein